MTLLIGTPSFMRFYLKSCDPKQFRTITHLILGAEKLKPELARDIQQALDIEPLEGYGCTELSPVVAVNVPNDVMMPDGRTFSGNRLGTVGLPLPGTAIKTVDPGHRSRPPAGHGGNDRGQGAAGDGRLPEPARGHRRRSSKDGWYSTGDLGYLDPDGFLKITDRISRFSKIAGEMVPHLGDRDRRSWR